MFVYIATFLAAILAGLVQAVSGFGAGIILMLVMPAYMPMLQASGTSSIMCMSGQVTTLYSFRKEINFKTFFTEFIKDTLIPISCYIAGSVIVLNMVQGVDMTRLKLLFGIFLLVLAIYYLFLAKKAALKPDKKTGIFCGGLSGVFSGAFGIGGPLIAIYYLAYFGRDKVKYVTTLQVFFFVTSVVNMVTRILNGILGPDCIPYVLVGFAGMAMGSSIGVRCVSKIDADMLKKIIYGFIGLSGVLTIIQNL